MTFDSRQKRLLITCVAAAFILPLLTSNDEKGGYGVEMLRYLVVGLAIVVAVPRIERWRQKSASGKGAKDGGEGPADGGPDAGAAAGANRPGAPAKGAARKAGTAEVVMLAMSRADAFDRALHAVQGLRRVAVTAADAEAGQITAKVGPSLRSVGEVIDVKVADGAEGRARVEVYCKARVTMTSSDRDKAEDNVLAIVRALRGGHE